MSRKRIALDIDDLMFETAEFVVNRHREKTGIDIPLMRYYIASPEEWGLPSRNELTRVLNGYLETDAYLQLGPRPEVKLAVARMAVDLDQVAVTGRPYYIEELTRTQLNLHFPGVFKDIFHTSTYVEGSARRMTKSEVCSDIGAVALVDDLPDHLIGLRGTNTAAVLVDCMPWSKAPHGASHIRSVSCMSLVGDVLSV